MPALSPLVGLLSLDVVAGLVKANLRAKWTPTVETLTVTGATNTSPIVVTVSGTPFAGIRPGSAMHVVLADVGGNTAANKRDATDLRNEAWHALVVDGSRLELWDISRFTGALTASVGNGDYTSGGTVSRALVDGRIQLGREFVAEQDAAPRVVFVPISSDFGPRSIALDRVAATARTTAVAKAQQTIATEKVSFEVHVWGGRNATFASPYDTTQAMYQQVFRSAHALAFGAFEASRGAWADESASATQLDKAGREFVFTLTLATPIHRVPLPLAPEGTTLSMTVDLETPDGTTETGFET